MYCCVKYLSAGTFCSIIIVVVNGFMFQKRAQIFLKLSVDLRKIMK
jgi:hypothetical protein